MRRCLIFFAGVILLLLVYAVGIEPFSIKVAHVQLENVDLNRVLKGKTAIHISDLHISSIGRLENQVLQR
jgi:predicted MPP superfamily phosphohydrolase